MKDRKTAEMTEAEANAFAEQFGKEMDGLWDTVGPFICMHDAHDAISEEMDELGVQIQDRIDKTEWELVRKRLLTISVMCSRAVLDLERKYLRD